MRRHGNVTNTSYKVSLWCKSAQVHSVIALYMLRPREVVFRPTSHLKMTRPPGFFFFFFRKPKLKENGVQTAKCIAEGKVWGPASRGLDGEATECRLCKQTKHCACMLNTDYVSQVAQRKLTRMRNRNRKLTLYGLIGSHTPSNTNPSEPFHQLIGTYQKDHCNRC